MPVIQSDDTYIELVSFETEDAAMQRLLVNALAKQVDGWIKHIPGFISASFHVSNDGKRVFNYAQWQSRAAWEIFAADARRALIRDAVKAIDARHISGQGYAVAQIIAAGS